MNQLTENRQIDLTSCKTGIRFKRGNDKKYLELKGQIESQVAKGNAIMLTKRTEKRYHMMESNKERLREVLEKRKAGK